MNSNTPSRNNQEVISAKSFVDCLTIDYRKTLNDYKIKIMEDMRKKATKTNMNQNADKKKI